MTSLWRHSRLTYYDLGPNFLTQGVELLAGEVWQVSKRNSQYFRSYLRKTTGGGPLGPPPSGARVKPTNYHELPTGKLWAPTIRFIESRHCIGPRDRMDSRGGIAHHSDRGRCTAGFGRAGIHHRPDSGRHRSASLHQAASLVPRASGA